MADFKDYTGKHCIINSQAQPIVVLESHLPDAGSVFYEVIRVVDGIFLFLEDHLNRLKVSVKSSQFKYNIDYEYLKETLLKLQTKNSLVAGNVKLLLSFGRDETVIPVTIAYQVIHRYPEAIEYLNGVKTSLFFKVRENPNIKQIDISLQDKCRWEIVRRKVYEVLLVDRDGFVTEGSKSNLFLVRRGTLFTPPADRILKGITREKVITLCKKIKCRLIEENIMVGSLYSYDAAFITGTSPKVLPLASADAVTYDPKHPLVAQIMAEYNELAEAYVKNAVRSGYRKNAYLQD